MFEHERPGDVSLPDRIQKTPPCSNRGAPRGHITPILPSSSSKYMIKLSMITPYRKRRATSSIPKKHS